MRVPIGGEEDGLILGCGTAGNQIDRIVAFQGQAEVGLRVRFEDALTFQGVSSCAIQPCTSGVSITRVVIS